MIKQKDNKIAKLTAEIAALKGEEVPTPAAAGAPAGPSAAASGTSGLPTRPGVFGRGGAQAGRPAARPGVARPIPTGPANTGAAANPTPTPTTVASIRGAAAAGRGGRIAAAAARGGRGGGAARRRALSASCLPRDYRVTRVVLREEVKGELRSLERRVRRLLSSGLVRDRVVKGALVDHVHAAQPS